MTSKDSTFPDPEAIRIRELFEEESKRFLILIYESGYMHIFWCFAWVPYLGEVGRILKISGNVEFS
jgi:hypothetical protein